MTRQSPGLTQRERDEEHTMQGHWLLASLGKRVLRPGGLGLTRRLLAAAAPKPGDHIVEFGPGVGHTARRLLAAKPSAYVGVDPNAEGRASLDRVIRRAPNTVVVTADAADTGLPGGLADLVVGEAMLTMASQEDKAAIIAEAARLLAPGGRYAIHELALTDAAPDPDASGRGEAGKAISREIKVGARPLKLNGWAKLLDDADLDITWTGTAPMRLLEPTRLIADEGLGAVRFLWRLLTRPKARARVQAMRRSFRERRDELEAVAIVAVKRG